MAEHQNKVVRREILESIRRNLAASKPLDAIRSEHKHPSIPRVTESSAPAGLTLVEQFCESLNAVGGHCEVVTDITGATRVVEQIIELLQARRIAVSDSQLVARVIEKMQSDVELHTSASTAALFECDLGITGAQWAVAETGTLVLESERERHRLVSLVPPVHVAVLQAHSLRQTLGEILKALGENHVLNLNRTVTFITGPSRTSDIELTPAIGVHGPGELYVIIIEHSTNE